MPKVMYSGCEYEVTHTDVFEYHAKKIDFWRKQFQERDVRESGFSLLFFNLKQAISDMETFLVRNKK